MIEAAVPAELKSGGAIQAFVPRNFEEAWRIAGTVIKAGMAPRGLETAEKVMVAIMHGQEVGFTPMAALQSIAVINGRPTIWGDGALGLVQGSGKMESIREWIEGEGDTRTAYCEVKRRGDQHLKTGKFSVTDAKTAGLWKKAGPWTQYSDRMLGMRARSWALRDGFSDVLKGLGVAEEVRDIEEVEHKVVSSEPTAAPAMPSVKVLAEPEAEKAAPVSITPAPGVKYLDTVVKVWEQPDPKAAGKMKYGIQTKALGAKAIIGTFDNDLAQVAREALAAHTPVDITYSQEQGEKPVLVSIEAVK